MIYPAQWLPVLKYIFHNPSGFVSLLVKTIIYDKINDRVRKSRSGVTREKNNN